MRELYYKKPMPSRPHLQPVHLQKGFTNEMSSSETTKSLEPEVIDESVRGEAVNSCGDDCIGVDVDIPNQDFKMIPLQLS